MKHILSTTDVTTFGAVVTERTTLILRERGGYVYRKGILQPVCGIQNESFHQHPVTPLDYRQETYSVSMTTNNTQRMIYYLWVSQCSSTLPLTRDTSLLVKFIRGLSMLKPTVFWQHPIQRKSQAYISINNQTIYQGVRILDRKVYNFFHTTLQIYKLAMYIFK